MEKIDRQWMINKAYNDLVNEIRQDLKYEIQEYIWQRISQMQNVLVNGAPIWEAAQGESLKRIYDAREKVWSKIFILRELLISINERY